MVFLFSRVCECCRPCTSLRVGHWVQASSQTVSTCPSVRDALLQHDVMDGPQFVVLGLSCLYPLPSCHPSSQFSLSMWGKLSLITSWTFRSSHPSSGLAVAEGERWWMQGTWRRGGAQPFLRAKDVLREKTNCQHNRCVFLILTTEKIILR